MCQIEEKVYIAADGTRSKSERSFCCPNSRRGRPCSNTTRNVIQYHDEPQPPRDDTSSPASYNPPTPNNGTYLVERRRPSDSGGKRPSTRDGTRVIKPEIIIEFGKKNSSKKYPASSTRSYKRSSLGAASVNSNDIAIESPGSDASFTVRTGFPEATVTPTDPGYATRHAVPQSHHRQTSSASSYTTSSQPPSLYATSEPDSLSARRPARYPPTIVHNPPPSATAPASPTTSRHQVSGQTGNYRTTVHTPRGSDESVGIDGAFSVGQSSASRASAAPEITDRDVERARQRQMRAETDRRRQEEAAREQRADEDTRQVRFDLGREESRAHARAENTYAEHERRREEAREEARQRKIWEQEQRAAQEEAGRQKAKRLEEEVARNERELRHAESKQRKDKRPTVRDPTKRHSRRTSMSQQDIVEQKRLLAETQAQMAREREAADQRERDERAAYLRQQQQTTQYWDPRGGDRQILTNDGPGVGRRNSVRRGSVSSTAPSLNLARTNSQRRVSVIQNAPPTSMQPVVVQQPYSTRPQSGSFTMPPPPPPPVFSPSSSNATYTRPPSARNSTYGMENPFAQPPTRISNTSQDNPFLPMPHTSQPSPPTATRDPWATGGLRDALPQDGGIHRRQTSDDRQRTLRTRGEEVIKQSGGPRKHDGARRATRNMGKVVGFEGDYVEDSMSEEERSPRKHHGKSGKRRG
ncbi:hypothetical protein K491DRAFT_215117 [Lophiostoma macrostomum CBS 122681]|uniref:Uncharacterized protein n=1 Tax=Lophiostoma macrostomum CBS 122681 TaxID=1314788 RepID=A0A6A6SSD3_9PLEO|nr:hypothetical protein K491DRAFT_215117 [Lophiostoma macrostomum CBS 122681]